MRTKESRPMTQTYLAIFACALLAFIGVLNETSMNVTYPELSRLFQVSLDIVQWITAGYLLMVTIVMGTTAFLLRRFSPRRLQLWAGLSFIVGALLCATAPQFWLLILGRLIQAFSTGIAIPLMFQLVFQTVPRRHLGTMTGMSGMVIALAPALGPTYGGAVSQLLSWRLIFWLLIPLALIGLVIGQLTISSISPQNATRFSWGALFWLALAMAAWVVAAAQFGKPGIGLINMCLLLAGLACFVGFILVNQRGQGQLFNLRIFRQPTVACAALAYFLMQFINIAISMVIPVYAQEALGMSALVAGFLLLPGSLIGAAFAPLAGNWADRTSFRYPVLTGAVLLLVGTGGFAVFQRHLGLWSVIGWYILLRVGFNLSFASTLANTTSLVPVKQSADVNSSFNMLQQFAGSLGVSLLAGILAMAQRANFGSLVTRTFVGGRIDFWLLTGLAIVVLVALLADYHDQFWGGWRMSRAKTSH